MRVLSVVVFSASTLDLRGLGWERGGPYRFIREALLAAFPGVVVRRGCWSSGAVFSHQEQGGRRVSILLRRPVMCRFLPVGGDAAVISPVYWELGLEDAAAITRTGFRAVVYDLQGFLRVDSGRVEAARYPGVAIAAYLASAVDGLHRLLFKASIEDLGDPIAAHSFLEAGPGPAVVTMGPYGLCLSAGGRCYHCEPAIGDPRLPSTGAGDVFSGIVAALLAQGVGVVEAVCKAVGLTENFLLKRAGRRAVSAAPRLRELPGCGGCLPVLASALRS